jgi:hypothetical protein
MPEFIHCKVCGKSFHVKNFADQMSKIRKHYKEAHPVLFKRSIKRGVAKRMKK